MDKDHTETELHEDSTPLFAYSAWHPINTAPSDEGIVLFSPNHEVLIWIGHGLPVDGELAWYPQDVTTWDGNPSYEPATHWMPLPAAPQGSEAGAQQAPSDNDRNPESKFCNHCGHRSDHINLNCFFHSEFVAAQEKGKEQ